jgi:DnaJ-class molecular chaperone
MQTQDYYRTLGIEQSATGDEIKQAYRHLAQRFHPDVSSDPDGERKFKAVSEAYRTLKLAETRMAYDRRRVPRYENDAVAVTPHPLDLWCTLSPWREWVWFCQR